MLQDTTASASCRRAALVALAGLALAGCAVHYSGAGKATTRDALTAQSGWVLTEVPEIRQNSQADCGPTALAILASRWGVDPQLARGSVAVQDNATFAELRAAARSLGLTAFVISADHETIIHELEAGRPVMVGLLRPYGKKYVRGHYEVVAGVNVAKRLAATVDPGGGWKVRTFAELDTEWVPTKRAAMVIIGTSERPSARQRTPPLARPAKRAASYAN